MKRPEESIFSQWTEAELMHALEERLDHREESEDPFPLVRPILRELDRRTGTVPFDTEKNWRALSQKSRKKRSPRLHGLLVAAVVLLCAVLCGLAAMVGLHEKLAAFFHAEGPQSSLLLPLTGEPEVSVQKDGVTIRVLQTITDTMGIYVLYEITVPESVTLPDTVTSVDHLLIPVFPLDSQDRLGGSGRHEILERSPHRVLVLSYTVENNRDPLDLPLRLYFPPTAVLYDQKGEKVFTLWEAEDPVILEWHCKPVDAVESWYPDILVQNGNYRLTKVLLSPISLIFFLDGVPLAPSPEPVTLSFSDGTARTLDSGTLDGTHICLDPETGRTRHAFLYRFSSPIDITSVETILIGGVSLSNHQNA